jgi:hypothetical protein
VESGRNVELTTYLHLLKLRMRGEVTPDARKAFRERYLDRAATFTLATTEEAVMRRKQKKLGCLICPG